MVRAHNVPSFLVTNRFDTYSALHDYGGPVLIIHGADDEVIPFLHARRLAQASPRARLVELPCHHNDCPPQWELVLSFLAENGVSSNSSTGGSP